MFTSLQPRYFLKLQMDRKAAKQSAINMDTGQTKDYTHRPNHKCRNSRQRTEGSSVEDT